MDQARNFVANEVSRRANAAGEQVNSTAAHLRTIADGLRGDDLGRPAAVYVDRGADTLEQVGRYLQQTDGDQLLADADSFGRERPWAVAAAGFLAGLSASRMFKAAQAGRPGGYSTGPTTSSPYSTSPSSTAASGAGTPRTPGTPISSDAAPQQARANASSTER